MMKGKMQNNFSEMVEQAMEAFDTALKTGVKMQEEASKFWGGMLGETNSMQELQERMRMMMMDTMPTTQRNIEQYMKMLDKTYHSSMELLKKAFETTQSGSMMEAQAKAQELWEATLAALRNNAQAMVQINARAMETWAQFAHKEKDMAEQGAEAMASAARSTSQAVHSATRSASQAAHAAAAHAARATTTAAHAARTATKAPRSPRTKRAAR